MKISNLAPVISIAREPEHKEKNLTLHRGYDEIGAARYIITSTLKRPQEETIGFFYTLDNAIECMTANHKLNSLESYLLEHPDPSEDPVETLNFLNFIATMEEDIDQGIKNHIYDKIPPTDNTDEIVNPEKDNQKSIGLTKELNKLVDQFVDNIRDSIS